MAARKTAQIPRTQRRRRGRELTLDPQANAILDGVDNASEYVSDLVIEMGSVEGVEAAIALALRRCAAEGGLERLEAVLEEGMVEVRDLRGDVAQGKGRNG